MHVKAFARLEVQDGDTLARMREAALPAGLRERKTSQLLYRDTYFDTPEETLTRRGVRCRLRARLDDRRFLLLEIDSGSGTTMQRFEAEVPDAQPEAALAGASAPARRLRALVDPLLLVPRLDLTIERHEREAGHGWLPASRFLFAYDRITAQRGTVQGDLHGVTVKQLRSSSVALDTIARALIDDFELRLTLADERERAERLLERLEGRVYAAQVQGHREVSVIAVDRGRLALRLRAGDLTLPGGGGGGEAACREVLRKELGSAEGQVALLGTVPPAEVRPAIEVWLARRLHRGVVDGRGEFQWFTPAEIITRVGSPLLRDPRTLAALSVAARSDLVPEWVAAQEGGPADRASDSAMALASRQTLAALRVPVLPESSLDSRRPVPDQFLNVDLSWLEFNSRVLALAEDSSQPLLARVRFAAIFSTNLDEFFQVRVAGHKLTLHDDRDHTTPDGLGPRETLEAIQVRLHPLLRGQALVVHRLLREDLPRHGIRVRSWDDLRGSERETLRERFDREVAPMLTPKAITVAPGHPFPHIDDLLLSLAVVVRDQEAGTLHFSHLKVPDALPRFVSISELSNDFIPIEQLIAPNVDVLFPGRSVEGVYPFRLTRMGDLELDEEAASSFAQAIAERLQRRPRAPVVRIEVAAAMPEAVRGLLLRELRFEEPEHADILAEADVYVESGLLNPGDLHELADLDLPDLQYPPFIGTDAISADSLFACVDDRDLLVHHPYDRFDCTFQRFIDEAASDPDVMAIKLTLYRPGGPSPLGDALERAARAGKDVSVFVELKARFDEERNLGWVQHLERAGIHVVTGLVNLKTHAKIALVVRRAPTGVVRYAHIGTGNYNPVSARLYTDLGLFTCRADVTGDLATLFNELTGSSAPPRAAFRSLLVSPSGMLQHLLDAIEREAAHARAGRGGNIRAKMNALNDAQVIGALYEASQAGVSVDLVIRGPCTLRPGVPGLSERIRVVSAVGRFLEHARIFHFRNAGADEYYIGSADWRPRNLRRRVEVVTPIMDPVGRARLDQILSTEIDDLTAYELQSDGSYVRVQAPTGVEIRSAQELFASATAAISS